MKFHPLAGIFPLIEGDDFADLVDDVRAHGVREPVVLFEGAILDGRNRWRASQAAGVECPTRTYEGDDPVGFVVSLNLKRRHLNASQRAMVAAKLANLAVGSNQYIARLKFNPMTGETFDPPFGSASANLRRPTAAEAAETLNVGTRSIETARAVIDQGAPELVHAVEAGDVSVSAAADVATLPKDEQREIVARGEREILLKAKEIRARATEQRRVERIAKAVLLCDQNAPLLHFRKYALILADPPWRYAFPMTAMYGAPERHYPTMALEEICALPVSNLAAPNAVLFLWVPAAMLFEAKEVIEAWGFTYASQSVWIKDKWGCGHYFRQQHENLLVATRGDMPAPPPNILPSSVINAPRREHSQKPDEAYELIECMYPELPKIELFARTAREGWAAWGNQAPAAVA